MVAMRTWSLTTRKASRIALAIASTMIMLARIFRRSQVNLMLGNQPHTTHVAIRIYS